MSTSTDSTDLRYDVLGIGNALVDVLSTEDDGFIERFALIKGSMALIDTVQAEELYAALGTSTETSGGSAANTIAGVASFGGRGAFIGRIHDDALGQAFAHDLGELGVHFADQRATTGAPTGRCMIVVTPDGERTMSTYLGASAAIEAANLDLDLIASATVTFLEGYLFDQPAAKVAFRVAAAAAHAAGRKVALTLSDGFCVDRHQDDFVALVDSGIDILFANEDEITKLYECSFDDAVARVRGVCELAAITRGEHGSVIVTADEVVEVAAERVEQVVDTTGAGDLYAAGFLFGLTQGEPLAECGRFGSIAAAAVLGHLGPRPGVTLAQLIGRA